MDKEKEKKKTLTISSNFKKKFDTNSLSNNEIKKPRRDPTSPYWAVRNTQSYEFKNPSRLTIFSIGQSEQYGYYKKITNWSTVFDSDLAEEIANPERLAIGTLDFNFVLILLMALFGNISQISYFQALKYKDISFISPFEYLRFIFITIFGILFFSEFPEISTYIGSLIIFVGITIKLLN